MMSKILCLRPRLPDLEIIISDINTLQEDYRYITNVGNDLCEILLLEFCNCIDDINSVLFTFKADYVNESIIAKNVESLFARLNIPFYCCSWNSMLVTATFIACIAEHGEQYFEDKIDFIYCLQNRIEVFNLVRSGRYYRIQSWTSLPFYEIYIRNPVKAETVFITILKEVPLDDISRQLITQESVINALESSKNVIKINNSVHDFTTHAIVAFVPQPFNTFREEKYALLQTCPANYYLGPLDQLSSVLPDKYMNASLISIRNFETIPLEKSIICYETIENAQFVVNSSSHKLLNVKSYGVMKIGTKVSLSMDKFFIPNLKITPGINNVVQSGAIISLTRETFSVEVIKNGVLYNSGLNNLPLMIGFFNGHISVGTEVSNVRHVYNSSIITDLMQLLTTTQLSQIQINPNWGFIVTRDRNNQIHLEFNTIHGRRSATPPYLLSQILKWSITKAEERLQQSLGTLIIATKLLNESLKQQLQFSVQHANLTIPKIQIQKYKIYDV